MSLPAVLAKPLTVPVVAAPLFLSSGPELVIAQCQAGVVGSFPALNARPAALLSEWLHRINEENAVFQAANPETIVGPVAVNQIVHRSNDRLEQDMTVIIEHQVPIVITSLGARKEINDAVHSYGGIVLHDVINNDFARKAIAKGADGIIAVAAPEPNRPSRSCRKSGSGSTVRSCSPVRSRTAGRFSRPRPQALTSPTSDRRSWPPPRPTPPPTTSR
jgi:nitronate monooxygenase